MTLGWSGSTSTTHCADGAVPHDVAYWSAAGVSFESRFDFACPTECFCWWTGSVSFLKTSNAVVVLENVIWSTPAEALAASTRAVSARDEHVALPGLEPARLGLEPAREVADEAPRGLGAQRAELALELPSRPDGRRKRIGYPYYGRRGRKPYGSIGIAFEPFAGARPGAGVSSSSLAQPRERAVQRDLDGVRLHAEDLADPLGRQVGAVAERDEVAVALVERRDRLARA